MAKPKRDEILKLAGGPEVFHRISERFHARVKADRALARLFPRNLDRQTAHLAIFLIEQFGGPSEYTRKRGKNSLKCRHAHIPIGADDERRWLGHMGATLAEAGLSDEVHQYLMGYFRAIAKTLADPLLEFYQLPLTDLRAALQAHPAPLRMTDGPNTLLGVAAQAWDTARVALLLELGADANQVDGANYTPLGRVARAGNWDEVKGVKCAELLISRGADVNAQCSVGSLTALHSSARRGTVQLGECLIRHGADVDARDSKGETPLRRAANLNRERFVDMLLSHGADPLSQDKRGVTVLASAKHRGIKQSLEEAQKRRIKKRVMKYLPAHSPNAIWISPSSRRDF